MTRAEPSVPHPTTGVVAPPPVTPPAAGPDAPPDPGAGPGRVTGWLWAVYPLAILAVNTVWGGVGQVLLGKQIAAVVPGAVASAAALGTVASVAAVSSVLSQPIVGRLSDRTRIRFLGRRNVWVFGCGVVGALGLVGMSRLTSTAAIAVTWAVLMWPLNGAQAALTAVLAERVPVRVRGTMSGLVGAATLLGAFCGVALAGLSPDVFRGYLLVAGVFLLLTQVFAFTTQDRPAPDLRGLDAAGRKAAARLPGLREHADYWWAFAGRFLLMFGFFSVVSFSLYILRDYVGVGDVDEAGRVLVAITALGTVVALVCSALGGWISDRLGRLRLFVVLSTLMFVPAGVIYLLFPTLTGAWVATAVVFAAFGVFSAVDQALITRVLPGVENAGRDLGIMNIANAGPQIIAPWAVGSVVALTGGYRPVFVILIVSTILGAVSVRFIRGVR